MLRLVIFLLVFITIFTPSFQGTLVYSLSSGWSNHDDEQAFVEALVFLEDGTASICFHSTGHGDPAVLSIELLQVGFNVYNYGPEWGRGTILRTNNRLSCGAKNPNFDVDYSGNHWGGDRFWNSITTFGETSDRNLTTKTNIKVSTNVPNYYPEALYQTALISTDNQPDLAYTMDVDPNRIYSVWLHFAEIDPSVTGEGQRVFDILINGDTVFQEIDIVKLSGDINSALVLNTTIAVSGRSLTITLHPVKGSHAIISAIEIFEIVRAEAKTSTEEGTFSAILLFYFLNDFLNLFVLSIEKLKVIKDVNGATLFRFKPLFARISESIGNGRLCTSGRIKFLSVTSK